MTLASVFLAVIIGTWNGNWFPSGRAEHRANPEVEAATISAAGKMLARGIAQLDPEGNEDLIIAVNDVRGPRVARELAAAIGRTNLTLTSISGYRRRDRFDQQQDAILSTLPVGKASWSLWKGKVRERPPRGYAYAELEVAPAVTSHVYSVHLKSNYGANTPEKKANVRQLRSESAAQLAEIEKPRRGHKTAPALVLGDFNADKWDEQFAEETVFTTLEGVGFKNALELLPPESRGTHPHKRYGNGVLDYILYRGFEPVGQPFIVADDGLSDHLAVFVRLRPVAAKKDRE